ncbi:MAG: hypothetical protein M0Z36_13210 [Thermaerobacter sp.]|nr:hypothetical protein [Thermaerobacter sp.]
MISMDHLVMVWGLVGLGGVGVALTLWQLMHRPRSETFIAEHRQNRAARRRRTINGINQGWIALTGLPLTPADIRHFGWLTGVAATVVLTLVTHNPLVGTAFGLVGLLVPETAVRYYGRKQWQQLDVAAYGAAHMLQAKLQLGVPVLEAFRALLADVSEPFLTWVKPCLTQEPLGHPLEHTLKERARAIQHVELAVLADVLTVERQHGLTAPIVFRVVNLWSQRIRGDAARRGKLSSSTMLGYGVVAVSIGAFWAIVVFSPAMRSGISHGLGFWATGIGSWLIAIAAYLQIRVSRQAEAI